MSARVISDSRQRRWARLSALAFAPKLLCTPDEVWPALALALAHNERVVERRFVEVGADMPQGLAVRGEFPQLLPRNATERGAVMDDEGHRAEIGLFTKRPRNARGGVLD